MVSTTVAATFGVTSLSLGGFARWADYGGIWVTWWLGDGVGAVVLTPLLILWISDKRIRWNWAQLAELLGLVAGLILIGQIVFCGSAVLGTQELPARISCAFPS